MLSKRRGHGTVPNYQSLTLVIPGAKKTDTDAAHHYRPNRCAAHLCGLLPEGAAKRRHLREPHGFILGIPLNHASASPLVVWKGSHHIIHAAFAPVFAGRDPATWGDIDVTDIYQAARRKVFGHSE